MNFERALKKKKKKKTKKMKKENTKKIFVALYFGVNKRTRNEVGESRILYWKS